MSELEVTLAMTLKEVENKNVELKVLQEQNAKLEGEKATTFDIIKGEKDHVVDMEMYRIWVNNPELDTSFLDTLEAEFVDRWQTRLDKEDAMLKAEEIAGTLGAAGETT